MVKKKRKARGINTKTARRGEPTCEEQRAKFPNTLVSLFISLRNDWNETSYAAYCVESHKYLGDKTGDGIEEGKLIVNLTRATLDIKS